MALDNEDGMVDGEVEGAEQQAEQQEEQHVQIPDNAVGTAPDREQIIADAFREGEEEGVLAQLAGKEGELTVEDLRQIPGAEGYTDEQLMAEWKKAQSGAGATATATGSTAGDTNKADATFKLPFPIYDDKGNKIEALEKISLKDLLEGKLQVGYNALGKEQRKTLVEALRNASQGHFNEGRYNNALNERNAASQRAAEAAERVRSLEGQMGQVNTALTALAMGNPEPMKKLAQDYAAALQRSNAVSAGMVPQAEVDRQRADEQAGVQFFTEVIVPRAYELANQYGADAKQIQAEIQRLVMAEPKEFMTREKLDAILNYELPATLERLGYAANGAAAAAPATNGTNGAAQTGNEVAELKAQLAALQKSVADANNGKTQAVRDKRRASPPAGSGSTPGAGDSMPSFKSRNQMKAWMQGDPDWAKA